MNEKYKCVVIDDEPLAITLMQSYIEKTVETIYEGGFSNSYKALKRIEQGDIDIVFTDIQMAGISGIEFAKLLPSSTCVIFTTAFPQYAMDGFRVNAIDYLLKPIQYADFHKAVEKAIRYIRGSRFVESEHFLTIKCNYQSIRLSTNDILYIEALKDYMKVVTRDKEYLTLVTMKQLMTDLLDSEFVRVHRSFIVNRSQIKVANADGIVIGDRTIPVSALGKDSVLEILNNGI